MDLNFTSFGFNASINLLGSLREAFETISWKKEPWLVGLAIFHVALPLFCIRFRKHSTCLSVILFLAREFISLLSGQTDIPVR
ncbi:hypothetical protein D915_010320 [Fasciola hepatica]|uniref:Transmembrane protein 18 n=1 Tax=Fasciola hepatica TaxID=6192 RepID=A0A4E0RVY2_FASHE|nr:hypothetical protein D915_010320 [Fasciola hepatica]